MRGDIVLEPGVLLPVGFAAIALFGIAWKTVRDKDMRLTEAVVLGILLATAAVGQIAQVSHYDKNLNTLSITCTALFFVIFGKQVSKRAKERLDSRK